ncbi:hypothetical protein BpHYR1_027779, partial [Brachionus plicatilis]
NCQRNQNILLININDSNRCSTTSITSSQTSSCSNASLDSNSIFNNFEYWSKSFNNFDLVKLDDTDTNLPNPAALTNHYYSRLYKPLHDPKPTSTTTRPLQPIAKNPTLCAHKMDSSPNYSIPLSVDFTRKLKRPSHIPYSLEFCNPCSFQGTILEDWLLLSFDEHLKDSSSVFRNEASSLSTSATNSATSFIIEYSYTQNLETDEITYISTNEPRKLNSESYKAAMNNCDDIELKKSQTSLKNDDYLSKRQEANFYVQQVLSDLIALGVLEFDSAFEAAINKTYKPKSEYKWNRHYARVEQPREDQIEMSNFLFFLV